MFWVEFAADRPGRQTRVLNQVSRSGECELTDGREASHRSAQRLSNMTESEEEDQIVTVVEQKRKRQDVLKTFPRS